MRSDQHSRGDASAIRRQLSGTGILEGLALMPQGHRPVLCAECRPQRSVPVGRHPALRASKQVRPDGFIPLLAAVIPGNPAEAS